MLAMFGGPLVRGVNRRKAPVRPAGTAKALKISDVDLLRGRRCPPGQVRRALPGGQKTDVSPWPGLGWTPVGCGAVVEKRVFPVPVEMWPPPPP